MLHLSVINDGASYNERQKISRHHLGDFGPTEHIKELRPIVSKQAQLEREQFGSKFSQSDITAACREVASHDRASILDDMRGKTSEIFARGRKWFDSVYGNTYHTVIMTVRGYPVYIPMQYGYGEQWKQSAVEWLVNAGLFPDVKYANGNSNRSEAYNAVTWAEAAYGLKRDL